MNAGRLFDHFDRISNAPGAVPRLRRFILDLAVRGKLAEQDAKDGPTAKLFERRLANPHRSGSDLRAIPDVEIPFSLPASWSWTRIGDAATVEMGQSPPSEHYNQHGQGIPFFQGKADFGRRHPTPRYWCTQPTKIARKDDVLICVRAPVGPINVADQDCCIGRGLAALRPHQGMELEFLVLCLQNFESALASLGFGTTFVAINKQQLLSFPVPLPPLAEQHRIVAKVNELMALCDRLEEAQAEREQRRDGLAAASLRRLRRPVDVGDDDILREHARFHLRYFQRLTTRPEQIVALRHTILSLAVCGRLVSQDPNDESALVQLAASDVVRAATARVDRRADHEGNTLLAAEQKWATPPSWEWRALADLVLFIDYRGRTPKKIKGGVRLITAKNVRKGFVSLSPEEFVSEGEYEAWMTRGIPRDGDVLFTTEAPMGNAAVVHLTERFALAQRVITFHPYGAIHPDFLVLQLLSEPFQVILLKTATGLTAKGIKAAKLKRLPIVVPPLAEQHRVVARVHELMAVCDRLQAQLATAQIESRLLLEAVLHEALLSAA